MQSVTHHKKVNNTKQHGIYKNQTSQPVIRTQIIEVYFLIGFFYRRFIQKYSLKITLQLVRQLSEVSQLPSFNDVITSSMIEYVKICSVFGKGKMIKVKRY